VALDILCPKTLRSGRTREGRKQQVGDDTPYIFIKTLLLDGRYRKPLGAALAITRTLGLLHTQNCLHGKYY
jgi:hypothetical protein